MSSIVGPTVITGANVFETSSQDLNGVGQKAVDTQGRELTWVKAGGSNISRGKLQLAPAVKSNHEDIAVNTAALGDTTVTVTLGATAATANEYSGGYLSVVDDTGEGIAYEIESHPAADASASLVITLSEEIKVAFGADTTVTLMHNPANGVVEAAAGAARDVVGVAANNISSGEYGWVVSRGTVPCLADEALTTGAALVPGTNTAGSVEELDDVSAPLTETIVGRCLFTGVDGEYPLIRVGIL